MKQLLAGAGVGAVEDGELVMSLGTSGTLFCPSSQPVMDVEGRIAPFCDATGATLPSMYYSETLSTTNRCKHANLMLPSHL